MTSKPATRHPRRRLVPFAAFLFSCFIGLAPAARAADTATATIRGVVSNAATGGNLNNASVRVSGSSLDILTDRDGTFVITGLAPGTYELTVSYTGLEPQTRSVTVSAGEVDQQSFELTSEIYKLDKFVVASEYEGNAAEINKQKKSDVFIQSISADMLGAVPAGNVGEFLKYVPGLLVDYGVSPEAETVSMRGQDADATLFTFDGMEQAATGTVPRSASMGVQAATSAVQFRDLSIDDIEAIEVFKAPPAWMSPSSGGVINAVKKNAFAQKGRRLKFVFSLNGNSQWLTFDEMEGPGPRETIPILPGIRMNYSEAFLNNRLGVSLTYGEAHTLDPRHNYIVAYARLDGKTGAALDADPTTDATPLRYSQFSIVNTTNLSHTRNIALNLDYRLGAQTVLKLNLNHNDFLARRYNNRMNLPTGNIIDPGATPEDTTSRNVTVNLVGDNNTIHNQNYGYTAKFEHRMGSWRFDGGVSYSKSDADFRHLPDHVQASRFRTTTNVPIRFRTSPDEAVSTIEQLSGPDIFDPANYVFASGGGGTTGRIGDARRAQDDRKWNLMGNVRRDFSNLRFPIELRGGMNYSQLHRNRWANYTQYDYVGPDGRFRSGDENIDVTSLSWTNGPDAPYVPTPPRYDIFKLADLIRDHPEQFKDLDGLNTRNAVANVQSFAQDITAGYVSARVRAGPKLTLVGGLRAEKTAIYARGPLLDPSLAAGIPQRNNPEANNQYDSHDYWRAAYSRTQRGTTKYRDYFPNWQASYRFTPDLILRSAVTRSMKRPSLQSILPGSTVSFDATTGLGDVTVNNTALNPTYSNNIDLALELYTRPSGTLSVGWFRKKMTGYIIRTEDVVGEGPDNGFDGQYAGYDLHTQENGGTGLFSGIEVSGRQQLGRYLNVLPEIARNWGAFFSYTKNIDGETTDLAGNPVTPLAPRYFDWHASYGVSYQTPRRTFYIEARATLFPQSLSTRPTARDQRGTYIAETEKWDLTARYRFGRRYSLEFNARNIFAEKGRELVQGGRVTRWDFYDTFYALSFTVDLGDVKLPFIDRR